MDLKIFFFPYFLENQLYWTTTDRSILHYQMILTCILLASNLYFMVTATKKNWDLFESIIRERPLYSYTG